MDTSQETVLEGITTRQHRSSTLQKSQIRFLKSRTTNHRLEVKKRIERRNTTEPIIKRSDAHRKYGVPDKILDQVCHMKNSPAFKYGDGTHKHWYFRENELVEALKTLERRSG